MVAVTKKPLVNPNLITLKCVLFTFFGGLGCIFPFLPAHMRAIGLNDEESRRIQIIAPAVSIIGPLVVCFLADRWIAVKKGPRYGSYIRVLTAILILLAALFFGLLLLVPKLHRVEQKRSLVSFACDANGAYILQEKCLEEKVCHKFDEPKFGNLLLTNCSYTCLRPLDFDKDGYQPFLHQSDLSDDAVTPRADALQEQHSSEQDYVEDEPERPRRQSKHPSHEILNAPPHICISREGKEDLCHAYVIGTKQMKVQARLQSAMKDLDNDTISEDWCRYPIDDYACNIPEAQHIKMMKEDENCVPVVECDVDDPYESHASVLADTVCVKIEGDVETTVWSYFTIRLLSDIFPLAALVLLDTAILIATRETSTGRGDVGHQYAWGSLGWAIFAPIVSLFDVSDEIPYLIPIATGVVLLVICALFLLFSSKMPLTPPEWWWHTKIGMLAIPMSAIRKYAPEVVALGFVSIVLGLLWSAVDQYQWWHLYELVAEKANSDAVTGVSLFICGLPAIPLLWYAERIVDYCGHNYILIGSFCLYVVRFVGLAFVTDPWFILFVEWLEAASLGLTFVTFILYMRHLVPRRLIATGQAIPVIGHFVLGRLFGSLIGLAQEEKKLLESFQDTYVVLAITAAVCALLYFLLYQFWLLPKCIPPIQAPPSETLHGQQPNGNNGAYTPLRVYHDGKAKKGHFRY